MILGKNPVTQLLELPVKATLFSVPSLLLLVLSSKVVTPVLEAPGDP